MKYGASDFVLPSVLVLVGKNVRGIRSRMMTDDSYMTATFFKM